MSVEPDPPSTVDLLRFDLPALPRFDLTPRRQVYLGLDPTDGHRRCWSADEDSIGLVGPPRYGKTSGIILPALMSWDGPAVATSTRGGTVYVYDPFGSEPAITTLRWTPLAGCTDPSICYRRVAAMVAVVGKGITDGEHWRAGAAIIMRAVFHAAALSGHTLVEVRRWLATQDTRTPADILRRAATTTALHGGMDVARGWADDLQAVDRVGERERGSFYAVARNCLDVTAEPRVLASTLDTGLDVDEFLATSSTLFIVGPSHYQQVAAPMIVGLVDSIAHRAAEQAATTPDGRLDPPLLLALDEVANIAPLQSLPALVSEGGGRGINTLWSVQALARLRARYGADDQQAILTATTAKLIYGGMSNGADLRDISAWAGEYREPQITYYAGASALAALRSPSQPGRLATPDDVGRMHAVGSLYRPALPVEALQQLPPQHAWLFYRSDPPLLVATPAAARLEPHRRHAGYTPTQPPINNIAASDPATNDTTARDAPAPDAAAEDQAGQP